MKRLAKGSGELVASGVSRATDERERDLECCDWVGDLEARRRARDDDDIIETVEALLYSNATEKKIIKKFT